MTQGGQRSARLGDQQGGAAPRGRLVEAGGLPGAGLPHGGPHRSTQSAAMERTSPVHRGGSPPPGRPGSAAPQHRPRRRVRTGRGGRSGRVRQPVRLDRTKADELRNVMSQPTCFELTTGSEHEERVDRRQAVLGVTGPEAVGERRMHGLTGGSADLRPWAEGTGAVPLRRVRPRCGRIRMLAEHLGRVCPVHGTPQIREPRPFPPGTSARLPPPRPGPVRRATGFRRPLLNRGVLVTVRTDPQMQRIAGRGRGSASLSGLSTSTFVVPWPVAAPSTPSCSTSRRPYTPQQPENAPKRMRSPLPVTTGSRNRAVHAGGTGLRPRPRRRAGRAPRPGGRQEAGEELRTGPAPEGSGRRRSPGRATARVLRRAGRTGVKRRAPVRIASCGGP